MKLASELLIATNSPYPARGRQLSRSRAAVFRKARMAPKLRASAIFTGVSSMSSRMFVLNSTETRDLALNAVESDSAGQ